MLTIILVESALELIPPELINYASIKILAKKKNKKPKDLLLDTSLHHNLMKSLQEREKRGRPDIVHVSLLVAINSPLYKSNLLKIYVHTRQDKVIKFHPEIRIPKNYNRFIGLVEQLFKKQRVPPEGEALMTIEDLKLKELIQALRPDKVILLDEVGKPVNLNDYFKELPENYHVVSLIGGFPHGSFSKITENLAESRICIDPEHLETVSVVGEVIHAYEQAINLTRKRFSKFDIKL